MNRLMIVPAVAALMAVAGCSSSGSGGDGSAAPQPTETTATTITVTSTDSTCDLSSTATEPGPVTFSVRNDGGDVTEFYLYKQDGTTVVGEIEDVAPGLTRASLAGSCLKTCPLATSSSGRVVTTGTRPRARIADRACASLIVTT